MAGAILNRGVELDLWSAAAVAALVLYAGADLDPAPRAGIGLLAAAGTVVIYNVDHLRDGGEPEPLRRARRVAVLAGALGLVGALIALPAWVAVACVAPGLLGLGHARLKRHAPGLKSWLVATAVALAGATLPAAASGAPPFPPEPLTFCFLWVAVAVNAHAMDLVDLDADRAAGTATLAVRRGPDEVKRLFTGLAVAASILLLYANPLSPSPEMPLSLIALALLLRAAGPERDRNRWRMLLDGGLMLPLALSLLIR